LITGVDVEFLVDQGYLVKDKYFVVPKDLSRLKTDASGEFTNKSINEVFETKISAEAVLSNYKLYSKGKKTLIFNNSIKTNNILFDYFSEAGVNVKKFDSNSKGREEVVDWFRSTSDAVLLNVGVFTTGFDVTDVETIILNRATNSLSLYLQMVGRGGRITDKIFKDHFNIIDLGGNVTRFGKWSSARNWNELYSDDTLKKVTTDTMDIVTCQGCDAIILKSDNFCEFCGLVKDTTKKKVKKESFEIAVPLNKFEFPKPKELVKYCEQNNKTIGDAFKLVENLFIESVISANYNIKEKEEEIVIDRITQKFRSYYFPIVRSNLVGKRQRKIITQSYKIYNKLLKI
jgi:superfamily II DNA or RNA helicase